MRGRFDWVKRREKRDDINEKQTLKDGYKRSHHVVAFQKCIILKKTKTRMQWKWKTVENDSAVLKICSLFCIYIFTNRLLKTGGKIRGRCWKCVGKLSLVNFSRLMSRAFFKFLETSKPKIPLQKTFISARSFLSVSYGLNETEN